MRRFRAPILITAVSLASVFASAQATGSAPLVTESLSVLDLTRLKVGSPILLRLVAPWSGAGCTLKAASIIEGRVSALTLHSRTNPNSSLEASFASSECSEQRGQPFAFKLAALIGGAPPDNGLTEATPLADVPGLAIGGGAGSSSFRSVQDASSLTTYSTRNPRALPASVTAGQVIGLSRLRLELGTSQSQSTTIVGLRQNLRLEPATRFILTARPPSAPDQTAEVAAVTTIVKPASIAAPPPEPKDEMEACESACGVVGDVEANVKDDATTPNATMPLSHMGYAPKLAREVAAFDYETNLLWLDSNHLLCTYDPHQLRTRGSSAESSRMIQAVVVNATTHTADRTLRWHARGEGRYLWQLGNGHILVAIGRELRIMDADLKTLHALPVDRPVAWVVSSPDAQHIVVALTEERHSPHMHDDLTAALGREPDEDLSIMVLDAELKPLFSTRRSAAEPVPVLADGGELRLKSLGRGRWKIDQYSWDQKVTQMSATKSTCRPSLVTSAGGLVFAVGCLPTGGRWYRVLRPDGHPLLKGESPSNELGLSAESDAAGLFAVRTVSTQHSMSIGQPFHHSDLARELISIYRSRDGSSVTSISSKDLTLSQLSYALSPDGRQVATVGKDSIYFFDIPPAR